MPGRSICMSIHSVIKKCIHCLIVSYIEEEFFPCAGGSVDQLSMKKYARQ